MRIDPKRFPNLAALGQKRTGPASVKSAQRLDKPKKTATSAAVRARVAPVKTASPSTVKPTAKVSSTRKVGDLPEGTTVRDVAAIARNALAYLYPARGRK